MLWLVITSLLWAFSFGLIKGRLAGVDPAFVAFARLAVSSAVFLPWFRPMRIAPALTVRLLGIGAVQYGLMYVLYLTAYRYLQAHEVALFTVTTPLWVTGLARWSEGRRGGQGEGQREGKGLLAALLAMVGGVLLYAKAFGDGELLLGFMLMQGANLAFAAGQVAWRRVAPTSAREQVSWYALLYVGGAGVCGVLAILTGGATASDLDSGQWLTLAYLGAVASGAGFFLWNYGATQTSAALLAVMNNAKIPLAVAVSFLVFGEEIDAGRLGLALAVFAGAFALARR